MRRGPAWGLRSGPRGPFHPEEGQAFACGAGVRLPNLKSCSSHPGAPKGGNRIPMRTIPFLTLALLCLAPLVPVATATNHCGDSLTFVSGTPSTAYEGTVTISAYYSDAGAQCGLDHWSFTFERNGAYFTGPWTNLGTASSGPGYYVITADVVFDAATWTVWTGAEENCCGSGGAGAIGGGSWTIVVNPPTDCGDGVDNDGDGVSDYGSDPGCSGPTDASERGTRTCDNGVDDDNDGQADAPADPGCSGPFDTSERGASYACDDGVDNDGDGASDYPSDLGCASGTDTTETQECGETAPFVQLCVTPGAELGLPVRLIDPSGGATHHVVGSVDVYRVTVPLLPPVNVPCVTLRVDGSPNACALLGTYVSTIALLVDDEMAEPALDEPLPVRICHAEYTILVANVGLPAFPGYTVC